MRKNAELPFGQHYFMHHRCECKKFYKPPCKCYKLCYLVLNSGIARKHATETTDVLKLGPFM